LFESVTNIPLDIVSIKDANFPGGDIFVRSGDHGSQLDQTALSTLQSFQSLAEHFFLAGKLAAGKLGGNSLLDVDWQ
jgi:hypothetical protein